ncbi:hypothetical protein Peur_043744 [Populus x canadensis]|jgi:F-box interacting protein
MGRKMAEEVTKDPIPNDVVMEGKMAEEEVTKDPIPEDVVMDGKMAEEEVTKDPIPEDVVMSILLKLPIKSILRFRCVSKSCNSLITSPYFIKKHFAKAKQLILRAGKPVASVSLHLDNDSLDRCLQLDFCQPNAFKVNGSCNGVVCLSGIHPKLDASGSVILWNPSIRKTLHLPPPRSYARIATTLLGIGYDPRTDDYKVARIVRLGSSAERPFVFQSYSLNSGSWNENVDFFSRSLENEEALRDITLYRHDNQAIVNGAIHWLLYRKGKINIERYINSPLPLPGHNKVFALSFNLSNESFGEIMLPECFDDRRKAVTDRSFSVFKDSLSVNVINCGLYSGRCLCEIWVMNQYDVRESWAIKYQIEMLHIARPVVHRSNGEILIAGYSWSRLVSFDPQTPRIRDTGLELSIDGYADYFVESLALLDKSN